MQTGPRRVNQQKPGARVRPSPVKWPGLILPKQRNASKAPVVYRPGPVPKVLQLKSRSQQQYLTTAHRQIIGPPVYRPEQKKIVQPKIVPAFRTTPAAPPVYRPETKTFQAKRAPESKIHPRSTTNLNAPPRNAAKPPVRASMAVVQRKQNVAITNSRVVQRAAAARPEPLLLGDRPWQEIEAIKKTHGLAGVLWGNALNDVPKAGDFAGGPAAARYVPGPLELEEKAMFRPAGAYFVMPEGAEVKRRIDLPLNIEGVFEVPTIARVEQAGLAREYAHIRQSLHEAGIDMINVDQILQTDFGEAALLDLLQQFRRVESDYRGMKSPKLPIEEINKKLSNSKFLSRGWFRSYFTVKLSDKNLCVQPPAAYLLRSHQVRMQQVKMELEKTGKKMEGDAQAIAGALFLKEVFREYGITTAAPAGKRVEIMITPVYIHTAIHEAIHLNAQDAFKRQFGNDLNEGLTEWLAAQIWEHDFGKGPMNRFYQSEVRIVNALVNMDCLDELKEALFTGNCLPLKAKLIKVMGRSFGERFIAAAAKNDLSEMTNVLTEYASSIKD